MKYYTNYLKVQQGNVPFTPIYNLPNILKKKKEMRQC